MFGAFQFGQVPFAGVVNYVTSVVASAEKGWPFAQNLRVPNPSSVPYFAQLAEIERGIEADDEDIIQILHLWARSR